MVAHHTDDYLHFRRELRFCRKDCRSVLHLRINLPDETLARIAELTSGAEVHLDGLGLTSESLNNESNVENWLREIGIIE